MSKKTPILNLSFCVSICIVIFLNLSELNEKNITIPAELAQEILREYYLLKDFDKYHITSIGVDRDYITPENDVLEIGIYKLNFYTEYKVRRFVKIATNGNVNLRIIEEEQAIAH